jgi:hypothetical protein
MQPLHDQYLALQYDEEVTVEVSLLYEDFSGGGSPAGSGTAQQFDLGLAEAWIGAGDIRRFDQRRVCDRFHQLVALADALDECLMGIAPAPVLAGLQGTNDWMQLGGVGSGVPHG